MDLTVATFQVRESKLIKLEMRGIEKFKLFGNFGRGLKFGNVGTHEVVQIGKSKDFETFRHEPEWSKGFAWRIHFYNQKGFAICDVVKKVSYRMYLSHNCWIHKLAGSKRIFQPSFAIRARFIVDILQSPIPPWLLGVQIEVQDLRLKFQSFSLGKPHQKSLNRLSKSKQIVKGSRKVLIV